ncbi:MAG: Rpn family recombination-promoting nuclease/putative transposase [Lachnospiraceae bacterium]|nr:Rpn family recombination-promoting nuclease/putative transposase [Lachnospiraceae bacterium]
MNNEKLNMQIADSDSLFTPLQHLNLMDDFLFDVTTVDLEACRIIIELSLGIRIREIRWKEGQKVVHNIPGRRGIRMDFYVEGADGKVFDVEMQKRNRGNIPKRTRYYQGLIDAPLLKSGEEGFDNLKPAYIVVICGFDLYHAGKYRYTFRNLCEEVPGLRLGDECTKIILNTKGSNEDEVEQSLVDFLHYIAKSDDESVPEGCDERLVHLHNKIKKIKSSEQMEVTYMKMEERDRQIREDGIKEGRQEGRKEGLFCLIKKKLEKGKTIEEIADALEEEVPVIEALIEEMEN